VEHYAGIDVVDAGLWAPQRTAPQLLVGCIKAVMLALRSS
jgi:hypothetical protein